MKFSLDLIHKTDSIRLTLDDIEADSPQDAMIYAKELHPDYRCDFVANIDEGINHEVVICESCQNDILDIDIQSTNEDETQYYCKDCSIALWQTQE